MQKIIFGLALAFAILSDCASIEAHSRYRHINSKGHVSYYHGHGGGHHHRHEDSSAASDIPVLTQMPPSESDVLRSPTVRPHKYLHRFRCGDHYCYKYPSEGVGIHRGAAPTDVAPSSAVAAPLSEDDEVARAAREFGVAAAVIDASCPGSAEMDVMKFNAAVTANFTRPMSPLSVKAGTYFTEGFYTRPIANKPCRAATDTYVSAKLRSLATFLPVDLQF